ncbi:MAG: GTP-binding protein [Nannocystaceae bacterium]
MQDARLPSVAVATVGHHRSGKTTVTAALHRLLADRGAAALSVSELDRRSGSPPVVYHDGGIAFRGAPKIEGEVTESTTVRSPKITYASSARRYVHIDCPGYRSWYKNSARGQAVADAILLVVSAPDAVQAQTREHLIVARGLGIRDVLVFLNKCDRVADLEWLDLVERDVRELLDEVGFDGDRTRILRGAAERALDGEGPWAASLHDLADALDTELPPRPPAPSGPPLLYLDSVQARLGDGPRVLVQGRLRRGTLRRGDRLALVGMIESTTVQVDDLEVFHQKVEVAEAGDQLGLLISRPQVRLMRSQVLSGQALVGGHAATTAGIRIRLRLLRASDGGRHTAIHPGHQGLFVFGASLQMGTIVGLERALEPGDEADVWVRLLAPLYLEPGMPVLLRDGAQGHQRLHGGPPLWAGTAGYGTVTAVGV